MTKILTEEVKIRLPSSLAVAIEHYRKLGLLPRTRAAYIRDAVGAYVISDGKQHGPVPAKKAARRGAKR